MKNSESFISITITDDTRIRDLNRKYLKRDSITDVLSFSVTEMQKDGSCYIGDVVVNSDQAKRQCKKYGNDYEHEIAELVAHGVLHLLGVHHDGDDEKNVHGVPTKKGDKI